MVGMSDKAISKVVLSRTLYYLQHVQFTLRHITDQKPGRLPSSHIVTSSHACLQLTFWYRSSPPHSSKSPYIGLIPFLIVSETQPHGRGLGTRQLTREPRASHSVNLLAPTEQVGLFKSILFTLESHYHYYIIPMRGTPPPPGERLRPRSQRPPPLKKIIWKKSRLFLRLPFLTYWLSLAESSYLLFFSMISTYLHAKSII